MTHRLAGMRCYCCGPMDRVPDGGVNWRREITPILHERGVIVFDPCDKPIHSAQDETNKEQRFQWIKDGQYDLITDFMKDVRGVDLRMVNITDFTIIRVDPEVHMCGSYEEIAIATHEKKPILVWTVGGKAATPWWLFGQIPHDFIFGSLEELIDYLDHVDTAPSVETHRRWMFFDQKKLYNPTVLTRLGGVS